MEQNLRDGQLGGGGSSDPPPPGYEPAYNQNTCCHGKTQHGKIDLAVYVAYMASDRYPP